MNKPTTSKLTTSLIATGAFLLILASAGSINAQTVKVPNGSIKAPKLANGSVTAPKIADGNVTTSKLANGSVTEPKLGDGSVTPQKLADGGVTTPKLADGSVTIVKLDPSVPVAEENVRIVRGTFGGGGEALAGGGTGYTVVRNSTGVFTVTFTVPFSADPTIIVTPSGGGAPAAIASVGSRTATGFVLSIRNSTTGAAEDWHSNFIAIGTR